ncbi:Periplasmic component of the Tol biopolymer transport system [Methanosarcina siciliae HI350]|uniref:Periplasmic component of the Tol biopolymer transport system n=1 Tax=Methanosarcina siciliae HI350 TaxID=1434119 RepID=A0A0E3PED1_9EURY|nr:TolB family protein [Methanosarcina siciliae]AKB32582.1 Periplasmic component of the Tol biopolymer transport system [Methanosarcina siciliae HI350]
MLKDMSIIVVLLFATNIALANPTSESPNLNVTSLDRILKEDGFLVSSTEWSPDGQYLLIVCCKPISRSNSVYKHYLLDTNSHTFGEIDYGIKELSSYSIPEAKWAPSGDKIYFRVSTVGSTYYGNCYIVCNPDGTNLKGVGTNFTDLSSILENLGIIGSQNNLKWSPDSSKIVFDWEKPGKIFSGVYLANGNGANARELLSEAREPTWYNSNDFFVTTDKGTVVLINDSGNLIRTFQPENEEQEYVRFSLSPDREKIIFTSNAENGIFQTYISDINGSKLKKYISYYGGTNFERSIDSSWQPDGSLIVVNKKGNLYILEGEEHEERLLYEGNATNSRCFPDGKKILFVENENQLYSIDIDGTNLSSITNFGLTTSYFWNMVGASQFSISPSGDIIAFTSALDPATGKIIENEPAPSTRQNVAAPLFIINSDGSNLTQVTPAVKGRYDISGGWSPNGKQFTIDSILFSKDSDSSYGGSFLVELNSENSSPIWKNMPVKEIIGSEESSTVGEVQINESNSANTSQITEHKETGNQSPSFMFFQLFFCIMGIWLIHKNRE